MYIFVIFNLIVVIIMIKIEERLYPITRLNQRLYKSLL